MPQKRSNRRAREVSGQQRKARPRSLTLQRDADDHFGRDMLAQHAQRAAALPPAAGHHVWRELLAACAFPRWRGGGLAQRMRGAGLQSASCPLASADTCKMGSALSLHAASTPPLQGGNEEAANSSCMHDIMHAQLLQ